MTTTGTKDAAGMTRSEVEQLTPELSNAAKPTTPLQS
ncbi:hypothetical protein FHX76_002569 [Lysinibacter cavernae]|uniref:Uncharacterized protein n=1 Tax=Lysinibacter cavernae TaxID=1640652 RepID=A0A7X5R2W8_9MICO|nr:hypothetical protein [Lysinibacter cavernae]